MAPTAPSPLGSRLPYAAAAVAIVAAGLLCRSPDVGLPWPVAKWSGSVLWGTMVYALTGAAAPRASASIRLTAALAIALGVELSRLWHVPWLDDFRRTTAGALLLGRLFSPWNMLAYAAGIGIGHIAERWWLDRAASR